MGAGETPNRHEDARELLEKKTTVSCEKDFLLGLFDETKEFFLGDMDNGSVRIYTESPDCEHAYVESELKAYFKSDMTDEEMAKDIQTRGLDMNTYLQDARDEYPTNVKFIHYTRWDTLASGYFGGRVDLTDDLCANLLRTKVMFEDCSGHGQASTIHTESTYDNVIRRIARYLEEDYEPVSE